MSEISWCKIGIPFRNLNRNKKKTHPGWEIRLEGQRKELQQQANMLRKEKTGKYVGMKRLKQNTRQFNLKR